MVKEEVLLEGKTLKGAPEMPLGVASFLVNEEVKLVLSWLATVEAAAAIVSGLENKVGLRQKYKPKIKYFLVIEKWIW